jgi:plasmid stabilization system protein ParE
MMMRALARPGKMRVGRKPFQSYLIFYMIGKERVEVLHVLHAARNYVKIIVPE